MLQFPRDRFLRGLCAIYGMAFASIREQIRGLYGDDGLEPVAVFLTRLQSTSPSLREATVLQLLLRYPTLVWLHAPLQWSPSFLMQALASLGLLLSLVAVMSRRCRATPVLAMLWVCYLSLMQCGQTFMRFQWDSFLLEVGFLGIWLAPWWQSSAPPSSSPPAHGSAPFPSPAATVWALRFLFFKFMLMSGAVKIQSRCPTWLSLSALQYHFASQPLPLPLSWFAHQLPPFVTSLGVAATLLLEGPWTWLLLVPVLPWRRLAVGMQLGLQVLILLTGNYNFFNLLTILLALSLLDQEDVEPTTKETSLYDTGDDGADEQKRTAIIINAVRTMDDTWQRMQHDPRIHVVACLSTTLFCVVTAVSCISIQVDEASAPVTASTLWEHLAIPHRSLHLLLSVEDVQWWIARSIVVSVSAIIVITVCATVRQCLALAFATQPKLKPKVKPTHSDWLLTSGYLSLATLVSCITLGASIFTMATLDPAAANSLPAILRWCFVTTQHWHLTSAYGLFRVMTGVATVTDSRTGQSVSVVARPELIIEGSGDHGLTWSPYHFQYKPGDVTRRPRLSVPFQPRLDWQMWFAALSEDYQQMPWLVHLVDKLLHADDASNKSEYVKQLLDPDRDPFPVTPPTMVRVQLYYYDFTRLNTSTSRQRSHLPLTEILGDDDDATNTPWWTRSFVREYLPPLERGNPSLAAFVAHHYGGGDIDSDDDGDGEMRMTMATANCRGEPGTWRYWTCRCVEALLATPRHVVGAAALAAGGAHVLRIALMS